MQAFLLISPPSALLPTVVVTPAKTLGLPQRTTPLLQKTPRSFQLKTSVAETYDASTVDYSSMTSSVFPAEACETVGGEACEVEMCQEVKLKLKQEPKPNSGMELVDREYLEYNSPKTVFLGEACDDLGGEFCEIEYQTGVY